MYFHKYPSSAYSLRPIRSISKFLALLIAFTAAVLFYSDARAQGAIENGITFQILNEVPDGASIEDICCGEYSKKFEKGQSSSFTTGFGRSLVWLKLSNLPTAGILDFGPLVDDVTLYFQDRLSGHITKTSRAGDQLKVDIRDLVSTHIVFEVQNTDLNSDIYVRLRHDKIFTFKPKLIEKIKFVKNNQKSLLIHFWIIGASTVMILFNLLLGVLVRQMVYFFYSLAVFCMLLGDLYFTGIGAAYIWGAWPNLSNSIYYYSNTIGVMSVAIFFYTFLYNPQEKIPILKWCLLPTILGIPIMFAQLIFPPWATQLMLAAHFAMVMFIAILVSLILALRGDVKARILLPTQILVLAPGTVMFWAAKFWSVELLISSDHIIDVVLFFDALLFSLLLAYRIRLAETGAKKAYVELDHVQSNARTRLLETLDNERRRVSADLHDTAGQGMMAITTRLARLLRLEDLSSTQQSEIRKAADYSRSVIGDIRRISHDLHPAIIDHLGWRNAIEELFNTLQETNDIDVELTIDTPENILNETQELHLYRIVQEVVSNISKHSNAEKCLAEFSCEQGIMKVEIADVSAELLQIKSEPTQFSIGQTIIDQRINTLDGRWKMTSTGNGVCVSFSFPIQSEKMRGGI